MLFHVSIDAADPRATAHAFATLMGGRAMPFPPVGTGSWLAFAGADDGTLVEVYPLGTALAPGAGDAIGVAGVVRGTATHFALGVALDEAEALAIVGAAGWTAKRCRRGGLFDVLECWIDGRQMIELLTPAMQADYRATVTIAGWEAMLAAPPPLARAA